jgi:hypothetical protein
LQGGDEAVDAERDDAGAHPDPAAVAAAGLSLGSGTAQANTSHPCMPPSMICNHIQTHLQRADTFLDPFQGRFGVGEGTRFDNRVDRFFGVK